MNINCCFIFTILANFHNDWLRDLSQDHQTAFLNRQNFFRYVQWIAYEQWRAIKSYAEARGVSPVNQQQARAFFERHFVPMLVRPETGGAGLVTGFYEPLGA